MTGLEIFFVFIFPVIIGLLSIYLLYQTFEDITLTKVVGLGIFAFVPCIGYIGVIVYATFLLISDRKSDFKDDTLLGRLFRDSLSY